jgi:hypothetical protein
MVNRIHNVTTESNKFEKTSLKFYLIYKGTERGREDGSSINK